MSRLDVRRAAALACACGFLVACSSNGHQAIPTPSASSSSPSPSPTPSSSPKRTSPTPTPSKKSTPKQTPKPAAPAFDISRVRIRLVSFMGGLSSPLFLTNAGDSSGLVYIVQQGGQIIVADGAGHRRGTFLDIQGRITSGGERGLLGLAFHPDFRHNRRFFVDYTDKNGNTNISEFRATSMTTADAGSERVILHVAQPYPNHNGGMVAFGADGFLYIGMGDGGSAGDPNNNGQSLGTLLGKILRIDVNRKDGGLQYAIPGTNPFAHSSTARHEIWSYGLRNPWRFSFDRSTHGMFIGDVGQNNYEEIDVEHAGTGGRNYGWRQMEGFHCYNPSTGCNRTGKALPITEYTHDGGNCAVSGGYVYRGRTYSWLNGAYFYADYCSGRIWALDASAALRGVSRVRLVLDTASSIASFGEDQAGELFVCDLNGAVYRLRAA